MDIKRPQVLVLMCTYNGEKYLNEQLTSIYCQKDVEVQVIVNDDGSVDKTLDILETWKNQGLVWKVIHTNRQGSTNGFHRLARTAASENFNYFAFSDQDDIWYRDKLSKQINYLNTNDALMVTSARDLVTENGKLIHKERRSYKELCWRNALIENCAPGNTQLVSKQGLLYLQDIPTETKYFDSMSYLFLAAFGKVSVIRDSLVAYRIHGNNQIGQLKRRNFFRKLFSFYDLIIQAEQFLMFDRDKISKELIDSIEILIGARSYNPVKMGYPVDIAYRQDFLDNVFFTIYIFFPRIIKNWIYLRVKSERK
jgi:glycosyltransferase involved in cell wall biosynthesis